MLSYYASRYRCKRSERGQPIDTIPYHAHALTFCEHKLGAWFSFKRHFMTWSFPMQFCDFELKSMYKKSNRIIFSYVYCTTWDCSSSIWCVLHMCLLNFKIASFVFIALSTFKNKRCSWEDWVVHKNHNRVMAMRLIITNGSNTDWSFYQITLFLYHEAPLQNSSTLR